MTCVPEVTNYWCIENMPHLNLKLAFQLISQKQKQKNKTKQNKTKHTHTHTTHTHTPPHTHTTPTPPHTHTHTHPHPSHTKIILSVPKDLSFPFSPPECDGLVYDQENSQDYNREIFRCFEKKKSYVLLEWSLMQWLKPWLKISKCSIHLIYPNKLKS